MRTDQGWKLLRTGKDSVRKGLGMSQATVMTEVRAEPKNVWV